MVSLPSLLSVVLAVAALTSAAASPLEKRQSCASVWAQCGGTGYTGLTNCCSGAVCTYNNNWYSQCLPGTAASAAAVTSKSLTSSAKTTTTLKVTATTKTATSASKTAAGSTTSAAAAVTGKLKYRGVNQAGAEFGNNVIPGTLGTNYVWPLTSSLQFFATNGANAFRVPFLWERAQPTLNGALNEAYLAGLDTTIATIASLGGNAIIEPHNFGRYPAVSSNTIGSSAVPNSAFVDFWSKIATRYKTKSNVILNIMNEPHDMNTVAWVASAQLAVNAIRAAGFTGLLHVPGNYWTGAWHWKYTDTVGASTNANAFIGFTDPKNNFAIEAHQYLDSDGSGTQSTCVSATIGVERLTEFTTWARTNGFKTVLGEIGGSNNAVCASALDNALKYLEANSDVWLGFTYWAAGPWWPESDVNQVEPSASCGNAPCKTLIWNVLNNHL